MFNITSILLSIIVVSSLLLGFNFLQKQSAESEQFINVQKLMLNQAKISFVNYNKLEKTCPSNYFFNETKQRCERKVDLTEQCGSTDFVTVFDNYKICFTYPNISSSFFRPNQNINMDVCSQALTQVCKNIMYECNTTDPLRTWAWAIATVDTNVSTLTANSDYCVISGVIKIGPSCSSEQLIDLTRIPTVTSAPSCTDVPSIIARGQFYYNQYIKQLKCENFFYLDLNNLKSSTSRPCSVVNLIKEKVNN